MTTSIPLALGTAVRLWFPAVAAIVLGSPLASHTLLALPIITRLGETRLEPSHRSRWEQRSCLTTLSLIVYAICAGIFHSGCSVLNLGVQLVEIAIFVPLVLFGLSRLGAYLLNRLESDEDSHFILMLGIMVVAGLLAQIINLPGIVGAFLAGLAVNAAVHDKPATDKLTMSQPLAHCSRSRCSSRPRPPATPRKRLPPFSAKIGMPSFQVARPQSTPLNFTPASSANSRSSMNSGLLTPADR